MPALAMRARSSTGIGNARSRWCAVNCEAVVDLSGRYLRRWCSAGAARRSTSPPWPLSAVAEGARLRRDQGLRAQLHRGAASGAGGHGSDSDRRLPGPGADRVHGRRRDRARGEPPDFIWMSAEDVAEEAVKATEAGKRAVVPGRLNYAGSVLGRHSPRKIVLPLAADLASGRVGGPKFAQRGGAELARPRCRPTTAASARDGGDGNDLGAVDRRDRGRRSHDRPRSPWLGQLPCSRAVHGDDDRGAGR